MTCTCGHDVDEHNEEGCGHLDTNDEYCPCQDYREAAPMTDTTVPDAAVQIAATAPTILNGQPVTHSVAAVAALARAGWLTPPAEVAALRAVAEAARVSIADHADWEFDLCPERRLLRDALDALPPADGPEPAPAQPVQCGVCGEQVRRSPTGFDLWWHELRAPFGRDWDHDAVPVERAAVRVPAGPQPEGETGGQR